MTAEYELGYEDWSAFNYYHHFHSSTARRQYLQAWFAPAIALFLICVGVWLLASFNSRTPGSTFLAFLPLFSVVPLQLAAFPWLYGRKVKKIVAGMIAEGRNRTLLGKQHVTISSEDITKTGDFDRLVVAWGGVERVVKTSDHAFIYISALTAIIVPRRAFSGSVDFDHFVTRASQYLDAASGALPLKGELTK
jgi:hypothetical protein